MEIIGRQPQEKLAEFIVKGIGSVKDVPPAGDPRRYGETSGEG
jgi:hypothetical protein